MSNRFHALSLGQGQAPIATRMIKEGVKDVSSPSFSLALVTVGFIAPFLRGFIGHVLGTRELYHLREHVLDKTRMRRSYGKVASRLKNRELKQTATRKSSATALNSGVNEWCTKPIWFFSRRATGCSWPTATCRSAGCRSWTSWLNSCRWRNLTQTSGCGSAAVRTRSSPSPFCKSASK